MKQKFLNSFYVLFLFTSIVQAQQTTRVVINSNDSGDGSLRKAIADAKAGDTITFRVDVGHITLTTGQIEINKSLTITGNGASKTKIDGNANGRIFLIINSEDVILKDMMLTNGAVNDMGGAIYVEGSNLTTSNLELSGNVAQQGGGALVVSRSILKMTGGNITGNTATAGSGGGINFQNGTIILDKVTVASNIANFEGGGIYTIVDSKLIITNSTIANNIAQKKSGGGLYFNSSLSADISTSTFSGNTATTLGGAIHIGSSTFTLDASTVVNNSASTNCGGIYNGSGKVTLKNTIVAKNNSIGYAKDVGNSYLGIKILSYGYNLIGQDSYSVFAPTTDDLVGTTAAPIDPLVGTLANNGGSTQTHKLLKESPARNAGDPADLLFIDQIGNAVSGDRRDIGAYEFQDPLESTVFDVKNSSSTVWPNPSNGTIKINLSNRLGSTAKGSLIEIASGKTVSEFAVNGNSEINLQNHAAGLYIVRLESESVTENHKLIIQ